MKTKFYFSIFVVFIIGACSQAPLNLAGAAIVPTVFPTITPTETITPLPTITSTPTLTPTPSLTPTPTATPRPSYDIASLTLEQELHPKVIDQFPIDLSTEVDAKHRRYIYVTLGEYFFVQELEKAIDLGNDIFAVAWIEGWYEKNGQRKVVIFPLVVRNLLTEKFKMGGAIFKATSVFDDEHYGSILSDGVSKGFLGLRNDTVLVYFPEDTNEFLSNFEPAVPVYTDEELEHFFMTGDASSFGNIVWPYYIMKNVK